VSDISDSGGVLEVRHESDLDQRFRMSADVCRVVEARMRSFVNDDDFRGRQPSGCGRAVRSLDANRGRFHVAGEERWA